jgi:hypothetical protein
MHLALIIDDERLIHEQAMLNRMCIGLMAESVQLTRIIPDTIPEEKLSAGEQRVALAARLQTSMSVLPWMRRGRAAHIAEALERSLPDVIYAVGAGAWQVGMDVAQRLGKPLLIDVCSVAQARAAPRGHGTMGVTGYVAPCAGIAHVLEGRVDSQLVSVVPMGVSLPAETREVLSPVSAATSIAILGSCRNSTDYEVMLDGLATAVQQMNNPQVFLELQGVHEHAIWRQVQQREMLGLVSVIDDASHYRSLLTRCDMLLMPEQGGELRSLMLEAMALAVPIVARPDAALDMLVDQRTAWLINQSAPGVWSGALRSLVDHPSQAQALGQAGRHLVSENFRSTRQVAMLLETLEKVAAGGVYRFRAD